MALGSFSVSGFGVALLALDRACKAADVKLIGVDTHTHPRIETAYVPVEACVRIEGGASNLREALAAAEAAVKELRGPNEYFTVNFFANPDPATRTAAETTRIALRQDVRPPEE
jgi:ethanolamine utilization protein EutM